MRTGLPSPPCHSQIDGHSHGAHAFLIDFRVERDGKRALVPNVRLQDMGQKTVANDLDNAWIAFDGVRVPEVRKVGAQV